MSEQPGRYQRSFSGLIGAMIVTLLGVAAFVGYRALNRDDLRVTPEPVDYLAGVRVAQGEGFAVPYPERLPRGWNATSIRMSPKTPKVWSLGVITTEDQFVGIRYEQSSVDDLVETYIDEEAKAGDTEKVEQGALSGSWQTWSDEGGDFGYSTTYKKIPLLVYGSNEEAVRRFAQTLTVEELPQLDAQPSASQPSASQPSAAQSSD